MHMLRMTYQSCTGGVEERLYPIGTDLRCVADAMAALSDGGAVMIEPVGNYRCTVHLKGVPGVPN